MSRKKGGGVGEARKCQFMERPILDNFKIKISHSSGGQSYIQGNSETFVF